MSNTLPPLVIPIIGDGSSVTAALARTQSAISSFSSKVGTQLAPVQNGLNKMGDAFKGLAGPIIAAAAAYATFHAGVEALNRADELGKAATSLGLTVEQLQELQVAARMTGGSAEGMNLALREMQRTLSEAQAGQDGAVKTLAELGLRVEEFKGLNPQEAFYKFADAMNEAGSAQDRIRLSQEVFGRGSKDLAETLTNSSKALRDTAEQARKFGMIISDQDNAKLKEANDAIEIMKVKAEAMVSGAMAQMSESINWISKQFVELNGNASATSPIVWAIGKALQAVAAIVIDSFRAVNMAFYALGGTVHALGYGITELATIIYKAVSVWAQWFKEVGKSIVAAFDWTWAAGKLGLYGFVSVFQGQIGALAKAFGGWLRNAGELMAQFHVVGGETLANFAIKIEDWGRTLPDATKKGMEESKATMAKDAEEMASTLSRVGAVRAGEPPEWLTKLSGFFKENADEAARQFDAIARGKSSIQDLVQTWMGLNTEVKTTGTVMEAMNKAPRPSVIDPAIIKAAQAEWEKLKKEVDSATQKVANDLGGPTAAEDAQYAARLKSLEEFNAGVIGLTEEKNAAIEQLVAAHEVAVAGVEIGAQEERIKAKIGYSDWSYGERMNAYDKLLAMENEREETRAAAIKDWGAANNKTSSEVQAALLKNHEEFEANRTKITQDQAAMRQAAEQAVLGAMSGMFGAFANAMDQRNRSQFAAWKAFSIAQALISTFLAATNVMAQKALLGPGPALAAAAMITAAGLANVAKIASTQFQGGGGGAVGGAGGTSAAASAKEKAEAASTSNVNVTLYGDNFNASGVRGLIGAINEAAGDNVNLKTQLGMA